MSLLGSHDQSVSMEASRYVQILDDVIERTLWDAVEYFVLDMPGGSSDVFRTGVEIVAEYLAGSIIVTQPMMVDATRKSLNLHEYFEIPVLGVVENMSYLQIGNKTYRPFGKSTIDDIAKEYNVKVLGKIPLSLSIAEGIEKGDPILKGEDMVPVDNGIAELVAAEIHIPGFWARMKEKISEGFKEQLEKVMIQVIVAVNKLDINSLRTDTGFREGHPFWLVITDESGTKEISAIPLRITENALKVLNNPPEQLDFQIATDFKTLARMIMGVRKTKKGELVPYKPEDAWYHGDLKAYGIGYTQYAIRVFRQLFSNPEAMKDIRDRNRILLMEWV